MTFGLLVSVFPCLCLATRVSQAQNLRPRQTSQILALGFGFLGWQSLARPSGGDTASECFHELVRAPRLLVFNQAEPALKPAQPSADRFHLASCVSIRRLFRQSERSCCSDWPSAGSGTTNGMARLFEGHRSQPVYSHRAKCQLYRNSSPESFAGAL